VGVDVDEAGDGGSGLGMAQELWMGLGSRRLHSNLWPIFALNYEHPQLPAEAKQTKANNNWMMHRKKKCFYTF